MDVPREESNPKNTKKEDPLPQEYPTANRCRCQRMAFRVLLKLRQATGSSNSHQIQHSMFILQRSASGTNFANSAERICDTHARRGIDFAVSVIPVAHQARSVASAVPVLEFVLCLCYVFT